MHESETSIKGTGTDCVLAGIFDLGAFNRLSSDCEVAEPTNEEPAEVACGLVTGVPFPNRPKPNVPGNFDADVKRELIFAGDEPPVPARNMTPRFKY